MPLIIFGNTRTVEHAAADTTVIWDQADVTAEQYLVIERVAIRLDGVGGAELRDSAGNIIDKLYAGSMGLEGSDGVAIRLPNGFGIEFETLGAGFLQIDVRKQ